MSMNMPARDSRELEIIDGIKVLSELFRFYRRRWKKL